MKSNWTPFTPLNQVLEKLVAEVKLILQDDYVGAYLQGSFATGDFDSHSDADFIIVMKRDLTDAQVELLQNMHERIHDIEISWAKYLEGSYFPLRLLKAPFSLDEHLWYIDNGSRQLEMSGHDNSLVVRSILREKECVLDGPNPSQLIDPVDPAALCDEIRRVTLDWGSLILRDPSVIGSHFYQSFAVLHFCRAYHDIHAGTINSKRVGTEWAKQKLDDHWKGLIDRSWSGRPQPELSSRRGADRDELKLTIEFVQHMMDLLGAIPKRV